VGHSAAWCKDSLSNGSGRGRSICSSGKSVLAACTLVQNIQHSRAEARATLFRPIEKVPKETDVHSGNTFMREPHVSQHLSGAHSSIPLFCTSFPPIGTASQGTIRVGSSENSMLRPSRRVGRVALRRSLPQQTWRFPRIDSRSIEASSAPTRRGAACARGCRLKAGTPLVLLASSVQWPRGEF
jgi:hypothetical protein